MKKARYAGMIEGFLRNRILGVHKGVLGAMDK